MDLPARLQQPVGSGQLGPGILEMLDHVPHGEDVVAVAAGGPLPDRLVVHGEAQLAGLADGPRRQLRALGPEPGLLGDVDEVPAVGAHVEEPS